VCCPYRYLFANLMPLDTAPASPIRVLLVDDQPALLWGLELLINGESPRMAVVGKASRRSTSLHLAAETQPDVIVLDLDLAGDLSLDFLPALMLLSPARVLIFTGVYDSALHARALRDGACGVVRKEESAEFLLRAIVHAHQSHVDTNVAKVLGSLGENGSVGL
jgi:two-component system, NarL family, nitrate/nitrite response regulator NarL